MSSSPVETRPRKPYAELLSGNGVFWLCAAVFFLITVARCWNNLPSCDEGWFFDPIYNWITNGHTGISVIESRGFPWEGIERYQFWQPPFYMVLYLGWVKLAGQSIMAFRGLSVVAGLFVLLWWYLLLRKFEVPPPVRSLAMVLIAIDYPLGRAGSNGRMDLPAAALGLGAVTAYLLLRERRFTWAIILSQTLVVCGGLTHPMGGLPYIALLTYFFVTYRDYRRIRWFHVAIAATPYIAGAIGWGLYIANDPELFRKVFWGSNAAGRVNGLNLFATTKSEILGRYLMPFGLNATSLALRSRLLIPVAYLGAAAAVWLTPAVRRLPFLRPFLAMWSIVFLTLMFFDSLRNGVYLGHITPLYEIFMATIAWWLWTSVRWSRSLLLAVGLAVFTLQFGGSLYLIFTSPYRTQYLPMIDFVRTHAKADDRIVVSAEGGYGLGFDRIHDDIALGYYVDKKPDVIIIDDRYWVYIQGNRTKDPRLYAFLRERLAGYSVGFRNSAYEVYLAPDRL